MHVHHDSYVSEEELYDEGGLLAIDLNAAGNAARPKAPLRMTVIGSQGIAVAEYREIKKECGHLCGPEDAETCRYVGYYQIPDGADIGTAVTALSGDTVASDFKNLWEERDIRDAVYLLPRTLPTPAGNLVFSPIDAQKSALSIDSADNAAQTISATLTAPGALSEPNIYNDGNCIGQSFAEGLGVINCSSMSVLMQDKKPLMLSLAGNNESIIRILSSFTVQKRKYYAVRVGLKGYSAVGLLYREKGRWVFSVRKRDEASLC